ncbi:MAG TPA: hypothetical protein VHZ24_12400 [Pirellulales bacterium]|jgi:hypothetical protein|nr:hypothetical protein [Pirellulales bacterium]
MNTITLGQLAHARSGDKGNHANIGVIAYTAEGFCFLRDTLTAERVNEYFAGLGTSRVERYELPRIGALNFVLFDALGGGASRSLRIDTQGKLLSTAIMELPLSAPKNLSAMLRGSAS